MCAVVLLVTHALTGLTVAFIGLVIAIFSLIVSGRKALHMLKSIDYKTLCTSQQKVDITLYFYTSFNEHNTPYTVLESDNSESMPDVLH